jgi:hypothetical protein
MGMMDPEALWSYSVAINLIFLYYSSTQLDSYIVETEA